jgi:hypothetical protein
VNGKPSHSDTRGGRLMHRSRLVLLAILIGVPVLALIGVGWYEANQLHWTVWLSTLTSACMALSLLVAWIWQRQRRLLRLLDFRPPLAWTERDQRAWALVQERIDQAAQTDPARLTEPDHYMEAFLQLGGGVARVYYPNDPEPLLAVTVPEILTAGELAARDLSLLLDRHLPGIRFLTLRDLHQATLLYSLQPYASGVGWVLSALSHPISTLVRFVAERFGFSTLQTRLRQSLLLWLYLLFLQRSGVYLVELLSGRLAVGAARYRELLWRLGPFGVRAGPGIVSRWKLAVVTAVAAIPFVLAAALGAVHLASAGHGTALAGLLGALGLGAFLGVFWHFRRHLLHEKLEFTPPELAQKEQRAQLCVRQWAEQGCRLPTGELIDWHCHVRTAIGLNGEVAQIYHPGEPCANRLTVLEVLSLVERLTRDLALFVDSNLPIGHQLPLRRLKQVGTLGTTAGGWWESALSAVQQTAGRVTGADPNSPAGSSAASAGLALLEQAIGGPVGGTLSMGAVSLLAQAVGGPAGGAVVSVGLPLLKRAMDQIAENAPRQFYQAFVSQLGEHLIALYSGRLRVGPEIPPPVEDEGIGEVPQISILVLGQERSGKSSLIRALLGPGTMTPDKLAPAGEYSLQPQGLRTRLLLKEAAGYKRSQPAESSLWSWVSGLFGRTGGADPETTAGAAQDADLLLLVINGADLELAPDQAVLKGLAGFFEGRPDRHRPPVVAVLTHADGLSLPTNGVEPGNGERPGEHDAGPLHAAAKRVRGELGSYLSAVVPVCLAEGKVRGIEENLLPAVVALLDKAHAVSVLRILNPERGVVGDLWKQFQAAGFVAADALVRGPTTARGPLSPAEATRAEREPLTWEDLFSQLTKRPAS